jgi:hypothetical protein
MTKPFGLGVVVILRYDWEYLLTVSRPHCERWSHLTSDYLDSTRWTIGLSTDAQFMEKWSLWLFSDKWLQMIITMICFYSGWIYCVALSLMSVMPLKNLWMNIASPAVSMSRDFEFWCVTTFHNMDKRLFCNLQNGIFPKHVNECLIIMIPKTVLHLEQPFNRNQSVPPQNTQSGMMCFNSKISSNP